MAATTPGRGTRIAAVLLGILSAFWGAVLVAVLVDLGGSPTCGDATLSGEDCFDGSGAGKALTLVFGWPSALAFIAVLPLAVYFAATGRRDSLLRRMVAAALILGLVTFVAARL